MTKKNSDAVTAHQDGGVPAYMAKYAGEGAEPLPIQTATPRLKIVQGMTDKDIKSEHGEGALVLMPDAILACAPGDTIDIIPIYRWVSWQRWADLDDDTAESPIVAEEFERGEIAQAAQGPGWGAKPYSDGRTNRKGGVMQYTHVESVSIAMMIDSGPCAGSPALFSWIRSGHKHGVKIARLIDRTGARGVPIYGNRIALTPCDEGNKSGNTYGVVRGNPAAAPFVEEERIADLRALHFEFKASHVAITGKTSG